MASLGQVIGALISQVARGRNQADVATAQVAQLYRDSPLLSAFPVPRMTLDEVVIDLKLAVGAAPGRGRITDNVRGQVLAGLRSLVADLPNTDPAFTSCDPKDLVRFRERWQASVDRVVGRLEELVPLPGEDQAPPPAAAVAAVVRGQLSAALLDPESAVPAQAVQKLLVRDAPGIERRLEEAAKAVLAEAQPHPAGPDQLDVLATASELQSIPPEKISSVKLTLRESDLSWTQYETEPGKTVTRLIPA
ncbi:MAG: hypothetical protein K6T75_05510 [Acetobacteraceae bacterium]|nr:hypothetical protein [Acetobacteraceae bacterium]